MTSIYRPYRTIGRSSFIQSPRRGIERELLHEEEEEIMAKEPLESEENIRYTILEEEKDKEIPQFHRQKNKRKFEEAFHEDTFDDVRYGGHINPDYFAKGGIGHGAYCKNVQETQPKKHEEEDLQNNEIYLWCLEYLKSKNIII